MDKKNRIMNNTMYNSNSPSLNINSTLHQTAMRTNYKDYGMHPLSFRNSATHNIDILLQEQEKQKLNMVRQIKTSGNNVNFQSGKTISQLLPNCNPDTSKLLHNNLTPMKRNELLQEYPLTINNMDRDQKTYLNPYKFTVKFNPSTNSYDANDSIIYGDANPTIKDDFENVRYIKLETAILPKYLYTITRATNVVGFLSALDSHILLNKNDINNNQEYTFNATTFRVIHFKRDLVADIDSTTFTLEFTTDTSSVTPQTSVNRWECTDSVVTKYNYTQTSIAIIGKPYILLDIDEINDVNEYSTNQDVLKSFGVLYPYMERGNYTNFHTANVDKIFKFSHLGKVKRMTLKFKDHLGTDIDIDYLNTESWVDTTHKDSYADDGTVAAKSPSIYMRHPLHHLYQLHLMFKLGVVKTEIDVNTFC